MTTQKLEIKLHDNSRVVISLPDTGTISLETYRPGFTKDGHGYLLRGTEILSSEDISALVSLLTSGAQRQEAA